MLSTDPPRGANSAFGRVIYRAGPNRFGGAMQLGLRRGGSVALLFDYAPFRVGHIPPFFGAGTALRADAVGALGSADAPHVQTTFLKVGFVTQPTMAPPPGSPILYPGPKLTTMFGTTYNGVGPIFYLPAIGIGPMGTPVGQSTVRDGFGHTTGTVLVQNTIYSATFFTVMGSDGRTALGAGNIAVVAGGMNVRHTLAGAGPYLSFQKVSLSLAPPIPSLSPAGVAAAAALVLLAAGYALRRRLG
jgi:hypothetical protein